MSFNEVHTVGSFAKDTAECKLLMHLLPCQPIDRILPDNEIAKEVKVRWGLFTVRQLAGAPGLFLAPVSYLAGMVTGFSVAAFVAMGKEYFRPSETKVSDQWHDWMKSTVILTPTAQKVEKGCEGIVAIINLATSITVASKAGVYTGIVFGGAFGWTIGRCLIQWVREPLKEETQKLVGPKKPSYASVDRKEDEPKRDKGKEKVKVLVFEV